MPASGGITLTPTSGAQISGENVGVFKAVSLSVTGLATSPSNLQSGSSVVVNWSDTNTGTLAAVGSFTDLVTITNSTTGQVLATASVPYDATTLGNLAAGASAPMQYNFRIPDSTPGVGQILFVVTTDVNNQVSTPQGDPARTAMVSESSTLTTPTLTLTLDRSAVSDAAGADAATATVTRNGGLDTDLVVTLASNDLSAATVPLTVTIPAGQASATFPVDAVDDGLVDGDQTPTLTASAAGFVPGSAGLTVTETDVPTLTLVLDTTTVEEGGSVTGSVERNWITAAPLAVTFSASTDGRMTLPVVIIPANQSSSTFTVGTVYNSAPQKDETFTLTAASGGFVGGTAALTITDESNLPTLTLSPTTGQVVENGAGITFTVTRAVAVDTPLTVKLSTSDATLAVPAVDSVVIPAYETSATFLVNPVENPLAEGTQSVTITANGTYVPCGCTILSGAGTATLEVIDNNAPALQLAANQTSAIEEVTGAFSVTVTRNTSTASDLVVQLASSDPTELPVPSTVTIPAGQFSTTVVLDTGSSPTSSGSEQVNLTASADGLAQAVIPLTVISRNAPDLGVGQITMPASGLIGQAATVGWTVSNTGLLAATAPWVERVYFSPDPTLDANAVLAAELTINLSLPAGASATRSAPVTLPTTPGLYYTIVVVDATNVLRDLDPANNQAVSAGTVDVEPTYSVTVSTSTVIAPAGTAVQFSGTAILTDKTDPAANVPVTVRVIADGQFRRVLTATTDADGNYTATFTPLPTEAGTYTVAAAHPAVAEDVVQAQFELVGMQTNPSSLSLQVVPGTPITGTVEVDNLGSVPLSGLSVAVLGAPANVTVNTSLSSTGLSGSGNVTLGYTISAADASTRTGNLQFVVTSTEGATVAIPLDLSVIPLTPELTSDPGSLLQGVVVGQQKVVSFDVTNLGGAASGPIQVQLPDGAPSWMALASPPTIASLAPSDTTTVTLILTPPADTPLALFEGTITLLGSDTHLDVGYQIRTVSTAVGDLQVSVEDEYTFFAAGAPLVAGATVQLLDPYDNTVIVAQGTTDAQGQVDIPNVPEGTYLLDVSAPEHQTERQTIDVTAGVPNQQTVFLQRQLVTYSLVATATSIPDDYNISLQSTFETGVPAPVVTIDAPDEIPQLNPGDEYQFMATITNHGLIAAQDATLSLPSDPDYTFTAPTINLGTIPAMSALTVPVIVKRNVISPSNISASDSTSVICFGAWDLGGNVDWECGTKKDNEQFVTRIKYQTQCSDKSGGDIVGGPIGDIYGIYSFYTTVNVGGYRVSVPVGTSVEIDVCNPSAQTNDVTGAAPVSDSSQNVCARVAIQVDQTAVVTSTAFKGTLTINNSSVANSLSGVSFDLTVSDAAGDDAGNSFDIVGPTLSGLSGVDGSGTIQAGGTGSASFTLERFSLG